MGTLYYMMAVGYLLFLQEPIKGIISSQTCCAIILLSWVIRCAVSHPCGKARYATQCILGPLRIVVWSVCRSFCRSHSAPSQRANLPLRVFALVSVYSSNRPKHPRYVGTAGIRGYCTVFSIQKFSQILNRCCNVYFAKHKKIGALKSFPKSPPCRFTSPIPPRAGIARTGAAGVSTTTSLAAPPAFGVA